MPPGGTSGRPVVAEIDRGRFADIAWKELTKIRLSRSPVTPTAPLPEVDDEDGPDEDKPLQFLYTLVYHNVLQTPWRSASIAVALFHLWWFADENGGTYGELCHKLKEKLYEGVIDAILVASFIQMTKQTMAVQHALEGVETARKRLDEKLQNLEHVQNKAAAGGVNRTAETSPSSSPGLRERLVRWSKMTQVERGLENLDEALKSGKAKRDTATKLGCPARAVNRLKETILKAEAEYNRRVIEFQSDRGLRALDDAIKVGNAGQIELQLKTLKNLRKLPEWGRASARDLQEQPRSLDQKIQKEQKRAEARLRVLSEEQEGARVNITLNRLVALPPPSHAVERIEMRTLCEDSLAQTFPSSASQQLMHAARRRQHTHDDDFISLAGLGSSHAIADADASLGAAAAAVTAVPEDDSESTARLAWEEDQWGRLRDQIINKISASFPSGHLAQDLGLGAREAQYAFAVTYESKGTAVRADSAKINPKFRVILVQERVLKRAYDEVKNERDETAPQRRRTRSRLSTSDVYAQHRWGNIKAMAALHYDGDGNGAAIKKRRLLMSDPEKLVSLSVPSTSDGDFQGALTR